MEVEDKGNKDLDLVNMLVRASFGRGFRGDYDLSWLNTPIAADRIKRSSKLDGVIRRLWFPIHCVFEFLQYAGKFTAQDGSGLEVLPNYETVAEKYAELYEAETGKRPSITLTNHTG